MIETFPSKKLMYTLISLLIVGFAVFYISSLKTSIYQLSFDWENKQSLEEYNVDTVKELEDNLLTLMLDPEKLDFDNQFTYCLKADKNYYFRYTYAIIDQGFIRFEGLVWINQQPEPTQSFTSLSKINLAIKSHQSGVIATTIGDELIYINEAKYLRKELYTNHKINFSGQKTDVYNLAYVEITNTKISLPTDTKYLILFSTNYPENIYDLANNHLSSPENKVIVVSQPKDLSIALKPFEKEKIINQNQLILIDPNPVFDKNPNQYYFAENSFLTQEAYLFIADLISKEIR